MNAKAGQPASAAEWRRRAEERLKTQGHAPQSAADTARLVHELQVHQIELEMQQEELLQSRAHVETLLAQYTDLYEFAPTGYLTLDPEGLILRVNLTGVRMLGRDRARLVNSRFPLLVAQADRPAVREFLRKVFAGPGTEWCEVALAPAGPQPPFVRLEGVVSADGRECRVVMIDLSARRLAEGEARAAHAEIQRLLALSEQSRRALLKAAEDAQLATEELRTSEARLRIVTDNARVGLVVVGPARRYLFANTAYAEILGLPTAGIIGQRVADVLAPVYEEQIRPNLDRAFAGERVTYELRWPTPEREFLFSAIYEPAKTGDSVTHVAVVVVDITERKQAEEELRAAEERYRSIFEHAVEGIYQSTPEGRFLAVNPAMAGIYGYASPEEMVREVTNIGRQIYADPEDRRRLLALLHARGGTGVFECQARRRDGTLIWVGQSTRAVRDASGQVICYEGSVEDITARREAEEALRRQHALVTAVVEGTSDAVFAKDLEGRYLIINAAGAQALGRPAAEILGHTDAEFVPESTARRFRETDAEVISSGQPRMREEAAQTPDGLHYWLANKSPMRDAAGRIIGVVGVSRDISERKQAEVALRESESRFRAYVTASSDVVYRMSADWREMRHLVGRNFIADTDSATRSWVDKYLPPDDQPHILAVIQEAIRTKGIFALEHRVLRVDGSVGWTFSRAVPLLDERGEILEWFGAAVDVTQRKEAEAEVLASREQLRALLARLQRAQEEERTRMAREIHDELGQLLTGLKMDTRWLERKLSDPEVPASLAPLLDRAVDASELADSTIAAVRKLAAELRPGALDQLGLGAALTERARSFQDRAGLECVAVVPDAEPPLPPEILTALYYICQEALTNVARHAHASRVEIHLTAGPDAVTLVVADDGAGLAEAGSGGRASLGLVGMRERAAHCGGTVAIGPNEPRGTRVTARIPFTIVPTKGETSA